MKVNRTKIISILTLMDFKWILTLLIAIFCLISVAGNGQKLIQYDKFGKKKAGYFAIGDEIHFKLKGEKLFYHSPIKGLDEKRGMIIFQNGEVKLEDIKVIRLYGNQAAVNGFALTFGGFGASWAFYNGIDALAGGKFTIADAIVAGSSAALGGLVKLIFNKRDLKFGKRRNMRIIILDPL